MNDKREMVTNISQKISEMTIDEFEKTLEIKLELKLACDPKFRSEFVKDPGNVARTFIENEINIKLPYNFEEKLIEGMDLYRNNKIQEISDDMLDEILKKDGLSVNITVGFVKFNQCMN